MNLTKSLVGRIVWYLAFACGAAVGSAQAGVLYVLNDNAAGNTIYCFTVNESTGALTARPGFPIATGGNGGPDLNTEEITLDNLNNRLYAINEGSDTVSAYSINPATGTLTSLPFSPISLGAGAWATIAVHPSGSPLTIGDRGGLVASYSITATTATAATGSPYASGAFPLSSAFSTDGNFLYAGGASGSIFAGFSVDSTTGVLTPLTGSPFASGSNPLCYATDASGRLFLADFSAGVIRAFTTSSGVPSAVTGNPFSSGLTNASDGALHPNGNFYVVSDRSGNQVGSYQIAGSGASTTLAPVAGSPFASLGTQTNSLVFNEAGTFLYAANRTSRNLTTYGVNTSSGVLTNNGVQPADTLGAAGELEGLSYANFTPTAADSSISGQLTTSGGIPIAGAVVNLSGTQSRRFITDASGYYRFDRVETSGFYTVRPSREGYSFSPSERSFSQTGNNTEAAFTGFAQGTGRNVLDSPEYFVRQQYLDFLGREPDEAGFNFWSDQILECGFDDACIEQRRINVSAAYFLSIEFQETGGLVHGLYRASYGRGPVYREFVPDTGRIAQGIIVGRGNWQQELRVNKEAFIDSFVERPQFRAVYDNLSNDRFVEELITHTGVSFSQGERDMLVSALGDGTFSRAEVLWRIAEDSRFVAAKRNEAFVLIEYFGYLRRDPDESGYKFWLNKLNQFNGNFTQAEMVKAFITSDEYRQRFLAKLE
jgi:6-phosphogluconolactonase (cycloisomerase 2 family)